MDLAVRSTLRAAAVDAMVLTRRLFAAQCTSTAADVIRSRAQLPAVSDLAANVSCAPIAVGPALARMRSCDSHFGYQAISKVVPLVFAWNNSTLDCARQLNAKTVPDERRPDMQFATPMITAIDYINENVNGHPGLIHGGMTTIIAHSTASLLAAINSAPGTRIVSQSLNMDYKKPIRTGGFVKIHAWLYG
ncbi:hypothetical protein H4R23_003109, partial [Coemansia sp. Cherry 401B]